MSSDLPAISNPLNHPLMTAGERFERTAKAKGNDEAGLRQAAQEFESLFVSYLLKVMRETIEQSEDPGSGFGRQIYTELFDQELARGMAQRSVLGIGDLVVRHLESDKAATTGKGTAADPAGVSGAALGCGRAGHPGFSASRASPGELRLRAEA